MLDGRPSCLSNTCKLHYRGKNCLILVYASAKGFTLQVIFENYLKILLEPLGECNLKQFSNITSSDSNYP